ncbi:MAG: transposase [Maioricimonas sp. JB045]
MRRYRRWYHGQVFFFTLVTHQRRRILTTNLGRSALRSAIREVRQRHPFELTAVVLLPDHLHAVVTLPMGERDYSTRIRRLKGAFTRLWRAGGGVEGDVSRSRHRRGERGIWQRRFYEHTVRDESDLKRCIDYVHVNPLKHRLDERVRDWPWSSFHRYVRLGEYPEDWGRRREFYGDEFRYAE